MTRKKISGGHTNHERWLVSYADFITLLFAFFVVLYASSQQDKHKMAQMASAIEGAFKKMGVFSGSPSPPSPIVPAVESEHHQMGSAQTATQNIEKLQDDLEDALKSQIQRKEVRIRKSPEGLVISLSEMEFFPSGSAVMNAEAVPAFATIAKPLVEQQFSVRVEGHTDNIPIHDEQFKSNWELSTARATEVIRLLIDGYSCAPERLSAAGYGEFHPIASNETEEGRSQNRRVDLVVLAGTDEKSGRQSQQPQGQSQIPRAQEP
jgi:chemotaxis protein MotB